MVRPTTDILLVNSLKLLEEYLGPWQIFMMELFAKVVNYWLLTNFSLFSQNIIYLIGSWIRLLLFFFENAGHFAVRFKTIPEGIVIIIGEKVKRFVQNCANLE